MTTAQKIIYYILLVLVSALFLFAAYEKLIDDPMAEAGFAVAHLPVWFMYFIGIAEVLGAIGLWVRPLRMYAASGLFVILAGAVVVTAVFVSVPEALFPLVTGIILYIIVRLSKKGTPTPAPSI